MNKFHMLLLSATICTTTPVFSMDLDQETQNVAALQQLSPQEIERFADGELGFICKAQQGQLPGFFSHEVENTTPLLPAEYFPHLAAATQTTVPDASSLPAEYFSYGAKASPEAVAPLPDYVQNLKEEALTQPLPTLSSFPPLTFEQISGIVDSGESLKITSADEYKLVSSASDSQKAKDYVGQKAFTCASSTDKFIDLMPTKVEVIGEELHYHFIGGNHTIPNPWYPHDDSNPTMEHLFEGHTLVFKRVNPPQSTIAPEMKTTEAVYSGGVFPIETSPEYTGGS